METTAAFVGMLAHFLFLNFLRGMETRPGLPLRDRHRPFLNFLRGMETSCNGQPPPPGTPFLNFLRGMETRIRGKSITRSHVLPKLP